MVLLGSVASVRPQSPRRHARPVLPRPSNSPPPVAQHKRSIYARIDRLHSDPLQRLQHARTRPEATHARQDAVSPAHATDSSITPAHTVAHTRGIARSIAACYANQKMYLLSKTVGGTSCYRRFPAHVHTVSQIPHSEQPHPGSNNLRRLPRTYPRRGELVSRRSEEVENRSKIVIS